MRNRYDVVIIGSGFGGAVVACRLAQAGRSVLVLERGKRWSGPDFPRAIGQVAAEAFWDEGRSYGFLEYAAFKRLDVIVGAGVGGGSLHYFNVNLPADATVFSDRRWPRAITRKELDPYYEMARQMLESAALQPPPGRSSVPERTSVFMQAAARAGYEAEQVPIAVYTGEPRVNGLTGAPQNPCDYSGNCLFGCDIAAKNTLDTNYLAIAERRHGAEIKPLHQVDSVATAPDGGYEVSYRQLNPDPKGPWRAGRVFGSTVVVAGGALGSTALLLACRDRKRTLPRLSSQVGRHFSLNGEYLFAHAYATSHRVDPGLGPPITARATIRAHGSLITVEDLGLPDQLMWYLEGAMPPRLGRLRGVIALAWSYLKRTVGLGSTVSPLSLALDALVGGGRTPNMIPYLGMGIDSSDGVVTLAGKGLEVEWSTRRNRGLYREMEEAMKAISVAAGGRFASSLMYRWPLRKVLTAHPLGGCAMGDDVASSVVNDRGEVWGYPGLYVVDGSIIPTALAVNPSLTIAALAERAATCMVKGPVPESKIA